MFSKKLKTKEGKSKMASHDGEPFKSDILKYAGIKHHERYEALSEIPQERFDQHIKEILY